MYTIELEPHFRPLQKGYAITIYLNGREVKRYDDFVNIVKLLERTATAAIELYVQSQKEAESES